MGLFIITECSAQSGPLSPEHKATLTLAKHSHQLAYYSVQQLRASGYLMQHDQMSNKQFLLYVRDEEIAVIIVYKS